LTQTDNHASIPSLSFFTGRMPILLPNQQRQSTEGKKAATTLYALKTLKCHGLNGQASWDAA